MLYFSEHLKAASGRYTDKTVSRNSKLVGQLNKSLDKVFGAAISELSSLYRSRRMDKNRKKNVFDLLAVLESNKLFSEIPGREFPEFPKYNFTENIKNPSRVRVKVCELSNKLDRRDNAVANHD